MPNLNLIVKLQHYLQSLQPQPLDLIYELEEKKWEAFGRWMAMSRSEWLAHNEQHGHDIFLYLVQSSNKMLLTVHDVINLPFNECRVSTQRSGCVSQQYYPGLSSKLELRVWPDFDQCVLDFIAQVPDLQLSSEISLPQQKQVGDESQVLAQFDGMILDAVSECCRSLSVNQSYAYFGANCGFSSALGCAVMADPDRIWISDQEQKCLAKLTIELKTPWSFESLDELIPMYEQEYIKLEAKKVESYHSAENIKRGKTIRAVEQIYGYMTLNCHRYGVLTTFNETVFFRKTEAPQQEGHSVLECSPVVKCSQIKPYTLIAAWIYLLSLIERPGDQCMFTPPRTSTTLLKYTPLPLDDECHWTNIISRGNIGVVAVGNFASKEGVVFKTADLSKWPDALDAFNHEVEVYKALESLQGSVIPKFIAYGTLQGAMQVIVLENVGPTMTAEQYEQRKEEVNEALDKIHALGYEHGNVRLRNLTIDSSDRVRIIDFERAVKKADGQISERLAFELS
ncbi:hypothetical protein MIR68_002770 [Amoeboaphelidium protococcarum]|nr:hypothetical protein MIR68_002770 [Amoeboaphelidium protococcarum]